MGAPAERCLSCYGHEMKPILMRSADADFLRAEVHRAVREVGYTPRGNAIGAQSFGSMFVFVDDAAIDRPELATLAARCVALSEAEPGEVVHVCSANSRELLFASDWVDGRPPPPAWLDKKTWHTWLDEDARDHSSTQ